MKFLYWMLVAALLVLMLEHIARQEDRGVCQPPQLSQVIR